jgi:hypothetical protein
MLRIENNLVSSITAFSHILQKDTVVRASLGKLASALFIRYLNHGRFSSLRGIFLLSIPIFFPTYPLPFHFTLIYISVFTLFYFICCGFILEAVSAHIQSLLDHTPCTVSILHSCCVLLKYSSAPQCSLLW